jgi:hypothetical protein
MARKLGPTDFYKTELKAAVTDAEGFKYSQDGKRLFKAPGKLKMCVIPDGVEAICNEAFYGRATYEEIDLPDSVKHIGSLAFCGCHRLKSIRIPSGVTVGRDAFLGCRSLPTRFLPEEYRKSANISIDDDTAANMNEAVDFYNDGSKTSTDGKRLFLAPAKITEYDIPEGVEVICTECFNKANSLVKVIFPRSVRIVGVRAFYSCKNLETVELNPELKEVYQNAFEGCDNIKNLLLSTNTIIDTNSFGICKNLSDKSLKSFLENLKKNLPDYKLIHFLLFNNDITSRQKVMEETGLKKMLNDYNNKVNRQRLKSDIQDFFFNSCGGCILWIVITVVLWILVCKYVF